MTKKELSQVNRLAREIEQDRRKLEELEWRVSAPQLFSRRGGVWSEKELDRLTQQISELQAAIAEKQLQRIQAEKALTLYISELEDSYTRLLLTLRFVEGLNWDEIAETVKGTPEAHKKYCNRQLKRLGVT